MRFKGLDLNLLQALDVLIERRSVTRAAEQLHISQPAISAALSRLRQHFDDPLLVQHGKQMIPTPFALRLQSPLKVVLGDLDALISTPARFDPASSTRRFRVMASDFILVAVLGDLLPLIEASAPGVRFVISPPAPEANKMLEAGEVDLVISPSNYVSDKHPVVPFFEERHVVAGWSGNPVMAHEISKETLTSARFISVQIGRAVSSSFAIHELSEIGITINSALITSSFAAVPQLLIGSSHLAILHESLARKAARYLPIHYWPLPAPIPPMREVIQCHRARAEDLGIVWLTAQFVSWADRNVSGS
jgi:DNA-binding transcriptional LysR family regulator